MTYATRMPSWVVRAEGFGSEGDPAVLQTAVEAISVLTALSIVMQRTRTLKWSDVTRIDAKRRDRVGEQPARAS